MKAKGDNSMPVKREPPEDVYGVVLQGPCDMARAGLLEPQFPVMQMSIFRLPRLVRSRPDMVTFGLLPEPSTGRAVGNDPTQGNERGA